jgi:hypothetical protein
MQMQGLAVLLCLRGENEAKKTMSSIALGGLVQAAPQQLQNSG